MGAWTRIPTALGTLYVAVLGGAVVRTGLPGTQQRHFLAELAQEFPDHQFREDPHHPVLLEAGRELEEYAKGRRRDFNVPLDPHGTQFQKSVWKTLARIPFGQVRTYSEVAKAIGKPGASRAVGQANHHNPVAPFIPCHRVVAASGGLGGYGGGVELKRRMLHLEGVHLEEDARA